MNTEQGVGGMGEVMVLKNVLVGSGDDRREDGLVKVGLLSYCCVCVSHSGVILSLIFFILLFFRV